MPYLLDSDVLIDVSRGKPAAREYLDALPEGWAISRVSALELIVGARDNRDLTVIDIGPEGAGIFAPRREEDPRPQPLTGRPGGPRRQPLGEQRRLAEASGCGDEHQLRRGPAVQPLAQPQTQHQAMPRPRDRKRGV